jgi:hypothetical protein
MKHIIDELDYELCPKDLPEWLDDEVRRRFVGGEKVICHKKGGHKGRCYNCGAEIEPDIGNFRQNESATCPSC